MTCNGMPSSFPQNFLYQIQSSIEESLLPTINTQDLTGFASLPGKRKLPSIDEMGREDDLSDDYMHPEEKKRRLNLEQVRTLEKSFETGSKLEPERKMQLAHELGLKPRQIAIWFQNRRARWKTKKMAIDLEALKRHFDALIRENEALLEHNKRLKAELLALKGRDTIEPTINLNKETDQGYSSSSEINLDISKRQATVIDSPQNPNDNAISFFPSFKPHNVSQFLHCNSRVDPHCPKAENNGISIGQEENFCNLFSGVDDQSPPAFWAWSEQHNFH